MAWIKKTKKKKFKKLDYSISEILKKQNKINDKFELMLNNLSLEEIIGLKLEVSARNVNYFLYGFPVWKMIERIVKEAVINYIAAAAASYQEASAFLGLSYNKTYNNIKKYEKRNLKYAEKAD